MKQMLLFVALLAATTSTASGQQVDTHKLDLFFNSLENRNEAMGSIAIYQNGNQIYSRAIGYRLIDEEIRAYADESTNYRIWSVTKIYTATMILQLVEEGKLSLQTTLQAFFPEIPNAAIITIQDMLAHRSGIHDFTQNDTSDEWDAQIEEPLIPSFMVEHISQYPPDFEPGEDFRYSNSNYLLLGYIVEKLDGQNYGASLQNRITASVGLSNTHFGLGVSDDVANKAFSYRYDSKWTPVDEGPFSGLIPAGAGGIVSTPADMAAFIDALFAGKLISERSLTLMLPDEDFYGLGFMKMSFRDKPGFGHTGGFIASESSLAYYPDHQLTIAYATNGIVLRKEDILDNVLRIYHGEPFGVSVNRASQALLIFGLGILSFLALRSFASTHYLLWAGLVAAVLFWVGQSIAGFQYSNYSYIKDDITSLDAFYSPSGTLMSTVQLLIAMLMLPFIGMLYNFGKRLNLHALPLLPLVCIPVSLAGSSLFPYPHALYALFTNLIILAGLSPPLAVFLWRGEQQSRIRWIAVICIFLMILSIGFIFSRPLIPEFVHTYWGVIQRLLYAGWTLWLASLSLYFGRK